MGAIPRRRPELAGYGMNGASRNWLATSRTVNGLWTAEAVGSNGQNCAPRVLNRPSAGVRRVRGVAASSLSLRTSQVHVDGSREDAIRPEASDGGPSCDRDGDRYGGRGGGRGLGWTDHAA